MFRTFPLSIIRSFSLYTQQWCMSHRFADSSQQTCVNLDNKLGAGGGEVDKVCSSSLHLKRAIHVPPFSVPQKADLFFFVFTPII